MIDLLHGAFHVHSVQFPHILDYFANVKCKLILIIKFCILGPGFLLTELQRKVGFGG